jgi:hypothetical protein
MIIGAAVEMARIDTRLRAAPAPVIDHRRFGPVRASFRRDSDAITWECLDLVTTRCGPVDLEFEADTWGPTAAHEQQLDAIIATLDALTGSAARAVAARFGNCDESSRGDASDLEWQGARVTGRAGTFQLHYWCNEGQELLLTVSFERWEPTSVEIHD